jgi:hypothetical protein
LTSAWSTSPISAMSTSSSAPVGSKIAIAINIYLVICYTIFVKWIDAKKEGININCVSGKATSIGFWGHVT